MSGRPYVCRSPVVDENRDFRMLIAPAGSTMYAQLLWLFGLPDNDGGEFLYRDINHGSSAELNFAARYILDELGIEPAEQDVDVLDNLLAPFGLNFPTTRVFSALARSCLPEISADANADTALMAWLEQEERLFRRLERRVVTQRLQEGFFRMANQRWISSSHSR